MKILIFLLFAFTLSGQKLPDSLSVFPCKMDIQYSRTNDLWIASPFTTGRADFYQTIDESLNIRFRKEATDVWSTEGWRIVKVCNRWEECFYIVKKL